MMTILEKIKTFGYWEVVIRPTRFDEQKAVPPMDLEKIAHGSQVRMRGWPFPIDQKDGASIFQDYIAGEIDWRNHVETWRFFRSGMFVWFKANPWDLLILMEQPPSISSGKKPGKTVSVGDSVYRFCEIFEFASRISLSAAGAEEMTIQVTCHGLTGRHLVHNHDYPGRECETASWKFEQNYPRPKLVAEGRSLALAAAADLFQMFRWAATPETLAAAIERQ
jgi:hypothetical protein